MSRSVASVAISKRSDHEGFQTRLIPRRRRTYRGPAVHSGAMEIDGRCFDLDAELAVDSATAPRPRGNKTIVLHVVSWGMRRARTHGRRLACWNFGNWHGS